MGGYLTLNNKGHTSEVTIKGMFFILIAYPHR